MSFFGLGIARRFTRDSAPMPLPPDPGTYLLILEAARSLSIRVGRLGTLAVRPGFYLYVGSAFGPGGLKARVERHLRADKRLHWHIDHLRRAAEIVDVWWSCDPRPREHEWAGRLSSWAGLATPMPGFGASDCRCPTHLFFARERVSEKSFRALGRSIVSKAPLGARNARRPGLGNSTDS